MIGLRPRHHCWPLAGAFWGKRVVYDETANRVALPGHVFDIARAELLDTAGLRVELRPQVLTLLECLVRHAGRVVPKELLMRSVWPEVIVTDDSLVQCIKALRRALHDDQHLIIRTEPKRGYRLVAAQAGFDRAQQAAGDAATFRQEIRYATASDGARIAYAKAGLADGPPLLRAAHWMTHLDWDWRCPVVGARLRQLQHHFQLWRYDGRGTGLSGRDVAQPTLDEAVADMEAVVDAARLDRFALLGPSAGGAITLRYAARHPDRVACVILIGGHVRGPLKRGVNAVSPEHIEALARITEDGWGNRNAAFRQIFTSQLFPGASAEQMRAFNHMQHQSCSPQAAADLVRKVANYDASADLPNVRCPTLVLHNPNDPRVPFAEARLVASMVPGARLETFESHNHTALPGEPAFETTLQSIIDFGLANAGSRSGAPSTRDTIHLVDARRLEPDPTRAANAN